MYREAYFPVLLGKTETFKRRTRGISSGKSVSPSVTRRLGSGPSPGPSSGLFLWLFSPFRLSLWVGDPKVIS